MSVWREKEAVKLLVETDEYIEQILQAVKLRVEGARMDLNRVVDDLRDSALEAMYQRKEKDWEGNEDCA